MARKIIQFIGGHEGFVSKWYLDPVHVPTIGFGFTWGSKVFREWWTARHGRKMQRGDTISKEDALHVLQLLVDTEYGPPVEKKFASQPTHVREAGKSMVYNCGPGALGWKWAQNIAAGALKVGCALWRKTATTARGKRLPGLVCRRNEEADVAEFNRWPSWMTGTAVPERHVVSEDIRQAQTWLQQVGYYKGKIDGIPGPRTQGAARAFQKSHGSLTVDGIIGPATLSALQRAVDLKAKGGKVGAGGGAVAGTGAAEKGTDTAPESVFGVDISGLGDWLLWGGVAILAVGLLWLGYRYRDELVVILKKV